MGTKQFPSVEHATPNGEKVEFQYLTAILKDHDQDEALVRKGIFGEAAEGNGKHSLNSSVRPAEYDLGPGDTYPSRQISRTNGSLHQTTSKADTSQIQRRVITVEQIERLKGLAKGIGRRRVNTTKSNKAPTNLKAEVDSAKNVGEKRYINSKSIISADCQEGFGVLNQPVSPKFPFSQQIQDTEDVVNNSNYPRPSDHRHSKVNSSEDLRFEFPQTHVESAISSTNTTKDKRNNYPILKITSAEASFRFEHDHHDRKMVLPMKNGESHNDPAATDLKSTNITVTSTPVTSPLNHSHLAIDTALPTKPDSPHSTQTSSTSSARKVEKCHICRKSQAPRSTTFAKCTGCGRRYHFSCHNPPITDQMLRSRGELSRWICQRCVSRRKISKIDEGYLCSQSQLRGTHPAVSPTSTTASNSRTNIIPPPLKRRRFDNASSVTRLPSNQAKFHETLSTNQHIRVTGSSSDPGLKCPRDSKRVADTERELSALKKELAKQNLLVQAGEAACIEAAILRKQVEDNTKLSKDRDVARAEVVSLRGQLSAQVKLAQEKDAACAEVENLKRQVAQQAALLEQNKALQTEISDLKQQLDEKTCLLIEREKPTQHQPPTAETESLEQNHQNQSTSIIPPPNNAKSSSPPPDPSTFIHSDIFALAQYRHFSINREDKMKEIAARPRRKGKSPKLLENVWKERGENPYQAVDLRSPGSKKLDRNTMPTMQITDTSSDSSSNFAPSSSNSDDDDGGRSKTNGRSGQRKNKRKKALPSPKPKENKTRTVAFDEWMGCPKNPIPCVLENGRLAYRDGTRDAKGRLPRTSAYFKVGRDH
ncbi:MAG: hypothetical protein M1834_004493 [Cirrosporium novae-zelandiae]|nr:MAG: hypothetical protein M1834_004493 [Cirrosporium novae-zelandiae]